MTWSTEQSDELYRVSGWGRELFSIGNDGKLRIHPRGAEAGSIALHDLCESLVDRGVELPMILRFPEVLRERIEAFGEAFDQAIEAQGYRGNYRSLYPIKVNQQRHLIEDLLRFGAHRHIGLEAGSKAELMIAAAMLDDAQAPIVVNGSKDRRLIDSALLLQRMGRPVLVVIEKVAEARTIIRAAQELGVRPTVGLRSKLSSPGQGRWEASSGDRAKFGLRAQGIVAVVEMFREAGMLDALQLLHFHIGSQVGSILTFQRALREAARLYVELVGLGAPMGALDVGGGVGVDYDGSRSSGDGSVNYGLAEYAEAVISAVRRACDLSGSPHPDIYTESGRALTAPTSLLLFDVLDVEAPTTIAPTIDPSLALDPAIAELMALYGELNEGQLQQVFHNARYARERAAERFAAGDITLPTMAQAEALYWHLCARIRAMAEASDQPFEDLAALRPMLASTYTVNLSIFQSLPDAWALAHRFPVLPIHRLDEEPTEEGVLVDLTCDSDGVIDEFIGNASLLPLHPTRPDQPYILAAALVGAYQETLGDLHNLYGDPNAVHVSLGETGCWTIDRVVEGDRVDETLGYVQFDAEDLRHRLRQKAEAALSEGRLKPAEARAALRQLQDVLRDTTYLDPMA